YALRKRLQEEHEYQYELERIASDLTADYHSCQLDEFELDYGELYDEERKDKTATEAHTYPTKGCQEFRKISARIKNLSSF
ncbi:hypothetical protein DFQ30_010553, partial [Apophysomyces sp. BC1015]